MKDKHTHTPHYCTWEDGDVIRDKTLKNNLTVTHTLNQVCVYVPSSCNYILRLHISEKATITLIKSLSTAHTHKHHSV